MPDNEIKPSPAQTVFVPKPVKFVHQKSGQYRIYHADNAWGLTNTWGNLQIDFCVEYPTPATAIVAPVKPDGNFTGEQKIEGVDNSEHYVMIRDFQCGVIFSLQSAIQARHILDTFINAKQAEFAALEKARKAELENAVVQGKK
jgi:hypothetical protein